MKLRIQGNSLRLRLQHGEVALLHERGRISESLILGEGPQDCFNYVLDTHPGETVQVLREPAGIAIRLPADWVTNLFETDQIGVDVEVAITPGVTVRVTVEKDHGCLS